MKIVVFGASGRTGLEITRQALEAGQEVTAFLRDPQRISLSYNNLRIVTGDAFDPVSVAAAIEGLGSKRYDSDARRVITHYCGAALGYERDSCLEEWRSRRASFLSVNSVAIKDAIKQDIITLQLTSCQVLADIGAEGTPAIVNSLRNMTEIDQPLQMGDDKPLKQIRPDQRTVLTAEIVADKEYVNTLAGGVKYLSTGLKIVVNDFRKYPVNRFRGLIHFYI